MLKIQSGTGQDNLLQYFAFLGLLHSNRYLLLACLWDSLLECKCVKCNIYFSVLTHPQVTVQHTVC